MISDAIVISDAIAVAISGAITDTISDPISDAGADAISDAIADVAVDPPAQQKWGGIPPPADCPGPGPRRAAGWRLALVLRSAQVATTRNFKQTKNTHTNMRN